MKLKILILSVILSVFVFPAGALAQREMRTTKTVVLPENSVIDKDFYVTAGESVEINGRVTGDVVAAGGKVYVNGEIGGDVVVAGGENWISGDIGQDLRAAGGTIVIDGNVAKNVLVIGGSVTLDKSASVSGGLIVFGGDVDLRGTVDGDVMVAAGNLRISGKVNGDIESYVGNLSLSDGAVIAGDLTYTSDNEVVRDGGSTVSGTLLRKTPPAGWRTDDITQQEIKNVFKGVGLTWKIFSFISALILGMLFIRFLPVLFMLKTDNISKKFAATLGVGFLTLIVTPVALVFMMISVVGIPLAMIVFAMYLIMIYLAKIYVSYWIGEKVFAYLKKNGEYFKYTVGLLIFYLVTMIPFIGGIISFIALLTGLGAQIMGIRDWHSALKAKKLI